MSLPYTFYIARRYHLGHTLLGRWMRRIAADRLQAEAYTWLSLTGLLLGLVLAQYLSWAFLGDAIVAAPGGSTALTFWAVQIGGIAVILLVGLLGWQPAITVEADADALTIQHGIAAPAVVPLTAITAAERIPAATYYGHYRRYARTQVYVNRIPPTVLALHTDDGPLMLGLSSEDQDLLLSYLQVQQGILNPDTPVDLSV